jgi:hypothetical protein
VIPLPRARDSAPGPTRTGHCRSDQSCRRISRSSTGRRRHVRPHCATRGRGPTVALSLAHRIDRVHHCPSCSRLNRSRSGMSLSRLRTDGSRWGGMTVMRSGTCPTASASPRRPDDRTPAWTRQGVRTDHSISSAAGMTPTTISSVSHPETMSTPTGARSQRWTCHSTAAGRLPTTILRSSGASPSPTRAVATRRPYRWTWRRCLRSAPHPRCCVTPPNRVRSCEGIPHRTACRSLTIPLDRPSLSRSAPTHPHVTQPGPVHTCAHRSLATSPRRTATEQTNPLVVPAPTIATGDSPRMIRAQNAIRAAPRGGPY